MDGVLPQCKDSISILFTLKGQEKIIAGGILPGTGRSGSKQIVPHTPLHFIQCDIKFEHSIKAKDFFF